MDNWMFDYIVGWAYTAGMFDGEGHVSYARNQTGKRYPCVYISNTNNDALLYMKDFMEGYGITVHHRAKNKLTVNRLVVYELGISDKASLEIFIEHIYTYLRIKRPAIDKAREMLEGIVVRADYDNNRTEWNEYRKRIGSVPTKQPA